MFVLGCIFQGDLPRYRASGSIGPVLEQDRDGTQAPIRRGVQQRRCAARSVRARSVLGIDVRTASDEQLDDFRSVKETR